MGPFEVIIVDSGSNQEDIQMISEYPVTLHEIKPNQFNFGLTRDYGFSLANGQYIVTISQDVIPMDEFWLSNLTLPFTSDKNIVAIQGIEKKPTDKKVFFGKRSIVFILLRIQKYGKINMEKLDFHLSIVLLDVHFGK